MTTKKKISLAMGLLLASTALQAQEVVNRGIDMSVVTGGVAVPTGTASGVQRNVKFSDRSYQIPENFELGSYYATWGIYGGRDYWPADVPVERLSEVYLAFGAICGLNPGAFEGGNHQRSRGDAVLLLRKITHNRPPRAYGRKKFAPRDGRITNFSPAAAPREIGSPACVDLAEMTEIIIGMPRSKRNTGAPEEP